MLKFRQTPQVTHSPSQTNVMRDILRRRMTKPQRHRLLHSFPLAAATPPVLPEDSAAGLNAFPFDVNADRKLLVGVLPHPFCNPAIRGCGFCTFPHEQFNSAKAAAVALRLIKELDLRIAAQPELARR